MSNTKFLFTVVGLMVAVFAICKTNFSSGSPIEEGFWGSSSRKWKVSREMKHPNGATFSLPNNYQMMLGEDKFVSNPSFQGILSPRMSALNNYGAHIRYNMPDQKNQGVPCNPLTFGNMVKENYGSANTHQCHGNCGSQGCSSPSCRKGGLPENVPVGPKGPGTNYAAGNYNEVLDDVYAKYPDAVDSLPVGNMTTLNASGEVTQPIIYDRYIFANRNSRLRSQGDWIRGDLPIVPCNQGWFNVHPNPNLDLNQGAMNVLGGVENETSRALADLIYSSSGNTDTTIGGVDLSLSNLNSSQQYQGSIGGRRDVSISGFP